VRVLVLYNIIATCVFANERKKKKRKILDHVHVRKRQVPKQFIAETQLTYLASSIVTPGFVPKIGILIKPTVPATL